MRDSRNSRFNKNKEKLYSQKNEISPITHFLILTF